MSSVLLAFSSISTFRKQNKIYEMYPPIVVPQVFPGKYFLDKLRTPLGRN